MFTKLKIAATILFLLTTTGCLSQTPVFSQFYTSGMFLNPAVVGVQGDVAVTMNYRSQWANAALPYKTFQLSYLNPLIHEGVYNKNLGGWGISILDDGAGPNREISSQSVSLAGAYNLHISRRGNNFVSLAGQISVLQQKLNTDNFRWSSQYSSQFGFDSSLPGEGGANDRVISPVANVGVMWVYHHEKNLNAMYTLYNGISMANINKPSSFYMDRSVSYLLYKIHGGMIIPGRKLDISPNYLIQYQNDFQLNVGAYATTKLITQAQGLQNLSASVGLWYRLADAFIFSGGLSGEKWNAVISYDTNSRSMKRHLGNTSSFEISAGYKLYNPKGRTRFSTPLI